MAQVTPEPNTGCWLWIGKVAANGYGAIRVGALGSDRRMELVHRVVYEHFVGPLIAGMDVDHVCRRRSCVNPDHLEQVSHRENAIRRNAIRSTCPRGHVYDAIENGHRRCTTCRRLTAAARSAHVDS